jgi:hypothetical protein
MMAFDEADQTIRAYEVKRGAGQFDAGKIRSIKRDLMCIQVLLKSYGETAAVSVRMRDGPFKSEEVALAAGKIALREFLELLESEQESDA